MKILAMADIHCRFEQFYPSLLPHAHLVIVAGDITDRGMRSPMEMEAAKTWFQLLSQRYPRVFYIPGNHDIGCDNGTFIEQNWWPQNVYGINQIKVICESKGPKEEGKLKFYGVSLTTAYNLPDLVKHWAYMTAHPQLEKEAFNFEPVDVVISHGPPFGILDKAGVDLRTREMVHVGSPELLTYIQRHQPRLVICGHAHGNEGEVMVGKTRVVNVAERWELIDLPFRQEDSQEV